MFFADRNMAIKCIKIHAFEPCFNHMKATGLLFHMVKARLKSVHFSALYGNAAIRSFSDLFLSKKCKNRKYFFWYFRTFLWFFRIGTWPLNVLKCIDSSHSFTTWKRRISSFIWWKRDSKWTIFKHYPAMFQKVVFFSKIWHQFSKKYKKNIKNVTCHASVTRGYGRPVGRTQ